MWPQVCVQILSQPRGFPGAQLTLQLPWPLLPPPLGTHAASALPPLPPVPCDRLRNPGTPDAGMAFWPSWNCL